MPDILQLEILKSVFAREPKESRKQRAAERLMADLMGAAQWEAEFRNDPIAQRIAVHIGSVMPHLIGGAK